MSANTKIESPEAQPEHLITPANMMTAARPILAAEVGRRLVTGRPNATRLMMGMALTDMEGKMAGTVDAVAPGSGYGRTELGKSADPIADSLAFAEVAAGTLASPRASFLGKVAVGIVGGTEGVKAVWAGKANAKHKRETGEQLVLKPSLTGKAATALKFAALTSAVRTHDLEHGPRRTAYGVAALASATAGAILGEKARRSYKRKLEDPTNNSDPA